MENFWIFNITYTSYNCLIDSFENEEHREYVIEKSLFRIALWMEVFVILINDFESDLFKLKKKMSKNLLNVTRFFT